MSTNRLDEILNYSAIAYATLADYVTPITETDVETFENYADMYCQKGNEHPEARTTRDNDIITILGNWYRMKKQMAIMLKTYSMGSAN